MASKTKKDLPVQKPNEGGKNTKNKKSPGYSFDHNTGNKTHNDNIKFTATSVDRILIFAIGLFALVFISLLGGLKFANGSFADIYVGNQKINANISEQDLESKIHQAASGYKLKLQNPDGKISEYSFKSVGVSVNEKASAKIAKNIIDNIKLHRLTWWQPIRIELVTKTNEEALERFISAKATKVKLSPANASLKIKGSKVEVIKEKVGSGYTVLDAENAIPRTIAQLEAEPLKIVPSALQPKIYSRDIQSSKRKIEFLITRKVKFNIAGHTEAASSRDIAAWLDLTTVVKAKTIDVTINSGKILEFINDIASPYIQPPRSRLITQTDSGQMVLDYGADGIDVVNKDQTASDLAKKLPEGRDITIDLSVNYAKADTVEVSPKDKWLVADVTNKRMYAYEKTKLVRTFLISAGAPLTPTVLGTFHIYTKFQSQDMRGANVDGSRYYQPDVPYVNYFYGDYAIHGNYWRPLSYFGNINSSHGCIGATTSDSEWIYYWAPIGTTVIVHS